MKWHVTLDGFSVDVEHDGVMDETEAIRIAKLTLPGKDFAVQHATLSKEGSATLPTRGKKTKRRGS